MAKKEVTKAPTGLSIVRSEDKFTASWKIGDKDYADGQYFQYAIDTTGKVSWLPTKNTGIGTKTTSKVITTIDKSNYYPNTDSEGNNKPFLYNICFQVKGNRKKYTTGSGKKKKTHSPSASAWARKDFVVNPPKKPTLASALDGELTNVCTFSWSAPYESNDSYIFTDVQWQTIFVKNSSEADGSKLDWSNAEGGISGAEGSKTITEDTSILYKNGNSYTRWFRARSRGPRGVYNADGSNGWVYEKHVYALSHQANVTETSTSETEEEGFQCTIDWTAGQSGGQNPIDKTIAQYTITIPDYDLTCPSGASWKDANISKDTEAGDATVFGIDDRPGKDQCLFIRVNTQHDSNITYGKPQLSYIGFLKDPSGLSVSTDEVTHRATITATNNSAVEDSILIVRYVPSRGNPINVGVIPHGSTSVTVQCPNWDNQEAIAFDVYAIVGTAVKQTRADGVDSYSVTARMRSQNTVSEGGAVPVAPENVRVSRVEGKSDTVRVNWDWPWSEAGSAEISWSDHDDAWESTDEPESFTISNLHASHWNISGLETGKTWYVRVRLIAGNMFNSGNVTYGPWSDISQGIIDLSSAPNKPVLILSNSIIPEDGSTIASWVYTTTDNTAQAYAEIAIVENGKYIPIAHSLTAQHITIPAQAKNYILSTGNIYNLVCRVMSASGRLSEWSDIVSLTVAEPINCGIVQTSLVRKHIETNPREFGPGDLLTFETELEEDFAKLQVSLEPAQGGYSSASIFVNDGTIEASFNQTIYGGDIDFISGELTSRYDSSLQPITPQTYQLTPHQVQTLIGQNRVWSDSGQVEVRIAESMRDVDTLTKMPLSIKVTGAGDGGITTIIVERAEDYLMVRPDETNFNGNKGEMVLQTSPPLVGVSQVSFNTDDLIGPMDDGAVYNIVATVQDGLGQKDSVTLPFEVHWEHQAEEPSAEIVIDGENLIAYIKPIAPANADPEDVADIYRLSADKPELIVEGAIFGETYVDPYPALGDMGGHRIVTRTKNGDYITEGNQIAMIDSPELGVNPIENEDLLNVIDFEGRQIRFYWETDYSNTWAKDFQETTYLGGSIEGDWNPAVSRSGTLSSKAITVLDQEMLKDVRRLANYPGICHVRTADGSSYAADVQVSEDYTDDEKGMVTNYSLSITKVGSQGFDGMTKEQWDDENPVEVEEGI